MGGQAHLGEAPESMDAPPPARAPMGAPQGHARCCRTRWTPTSCACSLGSTSRRPQPGSTPTRVDPGSIPHRPGSTQINPKSTSARPRILIQKMGLGYVWGGQRWASHRGGSRPEGARPKIRLGSTRERLSFGESARNFDNLMLSGSPESQKIDIFGDEAARETKIHLHSCNGTPFRHDLRPHRVFAIVLFFFLRANAAGGPPMEGVTEFDRV